jgi:1-deoxy-D-xylulose-5-phosphate reductoisomerase
VDAFLKDKIKFLDIARINAETISRASFIAKPSYTDFVESNTEARKIAVDLI